MNNTPNSLDALAYVGGSDVDGDGDDAMELGEVFGDADYDMDMDMDMDMDIDPDALPLIAASASEILSPLEYKAFAGHYFDEKPIKTIAKEMGVSLQRVYCLKQRAETKITDYMAYTYNIKRLSNRKSRTG